MRRPRQRRWWRHVLAVPRGKVTGKKSIGEGILCGELVVRLDERVRVAMLYGLVAVLYGGSSRTRRPPNHASRVKTGCAGSGVGVVWRG